MSSIAKLCNIVQHLIVHQLTKESQVSHPVCTVHDCIPSHTSPTELHWPGRSCEPRCGEPRWIWRQTFCWAWLCKEQSQSTLWYAMYMGSFGQLYMINAG